MNINKYINWGEIWEKEICLQTSIDNLIYNDEYDDETSKEIIGVINKFINDKEVELDIDECFIRNDDELIFYFSEQGGQNESDTQGWSREYCFFVSDDFLIYDAEYHQG